VIRWSPAAALSLAQTFEYINSQDPRTSNLIAQRVQNALELIALQPAIGTPTRQTGIRRFAVPKTGHMLEYSLNKGDITIVRWMRQSRLRKR
jgi:plasmid stabilization system protein ParE